jgi:hypothetical protein
MSSYPQIDQYNEAVQFPNTAFSDLALRAGSVKKGGLGLPLALGGGFAITYTVRSGGKKYAVRCFHKNADHLESRYSAISRKIVTDASSYFLGFEFQERGVEVNGKRYPLVKMDWAEGLTLGTYLERNYQDREKIAQLRSNFSLLEEHLRKSGIAHGDLQNGNVIVNNGIQLIDYDGMFVPGIPNESGVEVGHPHFQHPKRVSKSFGASMDRFSFVLIDLSLALIEKDPSIFQDYFNGENIVFSASDFRQPETSDCFSRALSVSAISDDVRKFERICLANFADIPSLQDFRAGKNIPNISIPQRAPAKQQYIGAYDVVDATKFDAVVRNIGNRIEIIGKITDIKKAHTRSGKPYVFINFGNWKGKIAKITIWSEGLDQLSAPPDSSWIGGWIAVTGLVDPPYENRRFQYTHVGITVTEQIQIHHISEKEAKIRLNFTRVKPLTDNEGILEDIRKTDPLIRPTPPSSPKPYPPETGINTPNEELMKRIQTTRPSVASQPRTQDTNSGGIPGWVWLVGGVILLILLRG